MKKEKYIIAVVIMLLVNILPLNSFAKFITEINEAAEFGVIEGSYNTYNHELHYAIYEGEEYIIFCTEYGKKSPTNIYYKYNEEFMVQYKNNLVQYEKMAEMIYFGYTMNYGIGIPNNLEAEKNACCTQQYVWEYIHNNIDENTNVPDRDSWNAIYMSTEIYNEWLNKTEQIYNEYNLNISFNNTVNQIYTGEEIVLKDTNNTLQNYEEFNITKEGITIIHEDNSNELKIISTEECINKNIDFNSDDFNLYKKLYNGNLYSKETMSNYIYFQFLSGDIQNLIFSNYLNPKTFNFSIQVIPKGKIKIYKYGIKQNGETAGIKGVEFAIKSEKEVKEAMQKGYTQEEIWVEDIVPNYDVIVTDDSGNAYSKELIYGKYIAKEIKTPSGFIQSSELIEIELTGDNNKIKEINIKNEKPIGTIIINKIIENNTKNKQFDLSKVEIRLIAYEDIIDMVDGSIIYKKGQEIGKYNFTNDGKLIIDNLPMGEYEIQESKTLDELILDGKKYKINIKQTDLTTKVYEIYKDIKNYVKPTDVPKTGGLTYANIVWNLLEISIVILVILIFIMLIFKLYNSIDKKEHKY